MQGRVAQWGDFDVDFSQLLGRGGMGTVYRARQRSLDRRVAVKVLDLSNAVDATLREGFLEKFRTEIAALSRLNDPRIVTIFQAGENEGRLWFAMELIDGRTVEDRLSSDGTLPEAEARRIVIELARALDAASRQGIIHRDVKPANVFLTVDGSVKLADFGLARMSELGPSVMTEARALACTPAYTSPEQADGAPCDLRSDIYSLGCVLFEMVTERPPFSATTPLKTLVKHALKSPTLPRVLNPGLSESIEAIILRCLEKEPDARFQSYPELIAALEHQAAAPQVPPRPSLWRWQAAAAAGLSLLGVIMTAVLTESVAGAPPPAVLPAPVAKVPTKTFAPPDSLPAPSPAPLAPLPYVREGVPEDARPVPDRADADPRAWFLDHEATPQELKLLRRAWAAVERHDPEIQAGEIAGTISDLTELHHDPSATQYTRIILQADIDRLRAADEVTALYRDRLRVGNTVDLRLVGGRHVSGVVQEVLPEDLLLKSAGAAGEPMRIARKAVAEETVYLHEELDRQLSYRATRGNSHGAAGALREALEKNGPDLFPRLPGLLHAIALRGAATLDSSDPTVARSVIADLDAIEKSLPRNLRFALEARTLLQFEVHAAEALVQKRYSEIVSEYERSRAYPRALTALFSEFQKRAKVECIAEGHREAWKYEPFETDLDVRRRHLYEDSDNKAFVLEQPEGLRAMRRSVPQAAQGYVLDYSFAPARGKAKNAAQWVLVVTDAAKPVHLQLVGTSDALALYETHQDGRSGPEVGRYAFPEPQGWRKVSILPAGKHLLIFDGTRLALKASSPVGAGLETHLQIGLTGGLLRLRSLKAASGSDE